MTTEYTCEQYTPEWTRLRFGKPTASQFHLIITPAGKPTDNRERRKYLFRLVAERLLEQAMDDGFESYWMKRGSDLEDQALEAFVGLRNLGGRKVGFFTAMNDRVGASPDYVLEETVGIRLGTGLEIKCPAPYTQVEYLIDGPGDKYKAQVQGQLFICNWQFMHFWAWHPAMPPFHMVTGRDTVYIARLISALEQFCEEVDAAEAFARGKGAYRLAETLRLSDEMASVGNILETL